MVSVTADSVANAIATSGASPDHPINELILDPSLDAALEDAALGGQKGTIALLRRRAGRSVSAADLARARQNADIVGQAGEGLINALLTQKVADGELTEADWSSARNAVCPYDFYIKTGTGSSIKLDVKSTKGPFTNDVHISLAEMIEAAESPERYDIYRVYDLLEEGGRLRVAEDIRAFARAVLASLILPAGVRCDGFSVSVQDTGLVWGDETYIARPDGDEN